VEDGLNPPLRWGKECFQGSHAPSQRGGPQRSPEFFATPAYAQTVWPTATKFDKVTQAWQWRVYRPATPPSQKGWLQRPPKLLDLLHARTVPETKKMHGDQTTGWGTFLHGRPRMLTRDLFAVANLLVRCCLMELLCILSLRFNLLRALLMSDWESKRVYIDCIAGIHH